MSTLSDKALEIAKAELAAGVRGGPPWAKFRGTRVDEYQRAVGLPLSPNMHEPGFPWCAAAVFWCFEQAAQALGLPNPCPKTAGALSMFHHAAQACQTNQAQSGAVFVLDRGEGRGHVGFVSLVRADGVLETIEPDTSNRAMSAVGDSWGQHDWDPAEGLRGQLVGYLAF